MEPITIDAESTVPPYEQLRVQIARQVADGRLAPGAKLATVRQTASDLGLAVNTVARAYRELEADGVIVTQGRRGTFVRSEVLDEDADGEVRSAAARYVAAARRAGLTVTEATRLVEQAWSA
jgi:DNA-binding transcriptional regulator YhcF (GntR family)